MNPQEKKTQDVPQAEKPAQQPEQELTLEDLEQASGGHMPLRQKRSPFD